MNFTKERTTSLGNFKSQQGTENPFNLRGGEKTSLKQKKTKEGALQTAVILVFSTSALVFVQNSLHQSYPPKQTVIKKAGLTPALPFAEEAPKVLPNFNLVQRAPAEVASPVPVAESLDSLGSLDTLDKLDKEIKLEDGKMVLFVPKEITFGPNGRATESREAQEVILEHNVNSNLKSHQSISSCLGLTFGSWHSSFQSEFDPTYVSATRAQWLNWPANFIADIKNDRRHVIEAFFTPDCQSAENKLVSVVLDGYLIKKANLGNTGFMVYLPGRVINHLSKISVDRMQIQDGSFLVDASSTLDGKTLVPWVRDIKHFGRSVGN